MFTLSNFQHAIEQQLFHNRAKSLFYENSAGKLTLSLSKEMLNLFKFRLISVAEFIKFSGMHQGLLKYTSHKTIQLFMSVNQYLDFSDQDYQDLEDIYRDVFKQVCLLSSTQRISMSDIYDMFSSHHRNLQKFLLNSNGIEVFEKYKSYPDLFKVHCTEYTPEFQLTLLEIDLKTIQQPVLDIGCGVKANLVRFFRDNGIEAYGIDRNVNQESYLHQANWTTYAFSTNSWGTVISHMAFSNHFNHHHLKINGNIELYAKKYMEILRSLKIGGNFIYAPSLPFIEKIVISSNKAFEIMRRKHHTIVKFQPFTSISSY